VVLLAGCGGPKPYVRPGFLEHPPARVAVLPFVITYPYDLAPGEDIPESHGIGRDLFRKTFYYALTPLGYHDIKPQEVDERLTQVWGPLETGGWRAASPQQLGTTLQADALVYGEIERITHVASPLYTETSLGASLRMVEAASGEVLWRKRVKVAERGGALVKKGQVVDFVKDQARSYNPKVKFLRVADAAARQALEGMPNPPLAADAEAGLAPGAGSSGSVIRLAILPLAAKKADWLKAAAELRADLAASFQAGAFEVVELKRVDDALAARGWQDGAAPLDEPVLIELANTLDADLLLRGTVTNWGRTYLAVQSWVKAALALELVDGSTGDVIWSDEKRNTRQAGILKGPTGYKSIVTAPITGLKSSHLHRVAGDLARKMADELQQSPAVLTYLNEKTPREL
jgi:hypothetical protein